MPWSLVVASCMQPEQGIVEESSLPSALLVQEQILLTTTDPVAGGTIDLRLRGAPSTPYYVAIDEPVG